MGKTSFSHRVLSNCFISFLTAVFLLCSCAVPGSIYAQEPFSLPAPGSMLAISEPYCPAIIRGITIYPKNPFKFDFIINSGDDNFRGKVFKDEANKLIKYFMTSLTVPENEMWVNLSPYEKNRVIANGLGDTQMGIDMLAQDYILKQLTASLSSILFYTNVTQCHLFWGRKGGQQPSLW